MTDKEKMPVTDEQRTAFTKVVDEADSDKLLELFEVGGTSDEAKKAYEDHRAMMVEKYYQPFMEHFGMDRTKEQFADALDATAQHHAELRMMYNMRRVLASLFGNSPDIDVQVVDGTTGEVLQAPASDKDAFYVPGPATMQ
jgi:hypothetical protein